MSTWELDSVSRQNPGQLGRRRLCTVVFMHLYEWDRYRYVQEAMRVLKPRGRCSFDTVDIASSHGWRVFIESSSHPI